MGRMIQEINCLISCNSLVSCWILIAISVALPIALLNGSVSSGTPSTVAQRLLSYKALFSICFLVFLLLPLVNRGIYTAVILDGDVGTHYTMSPTTGVTVKITGIASVGMMFAYLLVGDVWLSLASRFGSKRLAALSKSWLQRVVVVAFATLSVVWVWGVLSAGTVVRHQVVSVAATLSFGLMTSLFLTVGAGVMYGTPAIYILT